jgi:hypothetical protein
MASRLKATSTNLRSSAIVYVYESEGTREESSPSFFQHLVDTMIPEHLR